MAWEQSLEKRITAAIDSLTPKQKRLARLVLEDRYFLAFASTGETALKTGTSAATVVRFAQTIGYSGYPEMQTAIRAELPTHLTAVERIQARLAKPQPPEEAIHQVFDADIKNIIRTAEMLPAAALDSAVNTITSAESILVIGSGLSASPALFLAHSLKVMGFNARPVINEGLSLAVDLSQLRPGKLLIAVDLRRYLRSTVKAVAAAKRAGAATIAITDNKVSRLARMADYAFVVATDGVAHSHSATAVMSLLNVFLAQLSYRMPERILESLRKVDAAYRENDILIRE